MQSSAPSHAHTCSSTLAPPARSAERSTHSSAECARAISPGPKHRAGMPASLNSAASVQHDNPSTGVALPFDASRPHRTARVSGASIARSTRRLRAHEPRRRRANRSTRSRQLAHSSVDLGQRRSVVSPGMVRRSMRSAHCSAYVDHPVPPCDHCGVQRRAAQQRMRARGRVRRVRIDRAPPGAARHAGWHRRPRRSRLPCAARPCKRHLDPREPFVRRTHGQARGFRDDRAGGVQPVWPASARVPIDSNSSSHTAVMMISLASAPCAAARAAATHIAAMPPFMSRGAAPVQRSPSVIGVNGACVMPSVPTTSRCPFRISGERPAGPMRATTFGRPGATSVSDTANPQPRSTCAEKLRARAFARRTGTSCGLRESMATSASVSAIGVEGNREGTCGE